MNIKHYALVAVISSVVASASWAGIKATSQEAALNGVWQLTSRVGAQLKDINGKAPPLNAAGKKLYEERKALFANGDTSYDLTQQCKPMGFPRVLWDGSPFDMQVVTNESVFQGFTFNRNHRVFVEWSKDAPTMQIPRYYGTSSAQWDGNTLVIKSGMYNENSLLDSTGLPLADTMTLTERYIPSKDGKRMEVRLTITDSKYYTRPWEVSVKFDKVTNGRIAEDVCQERAQFYKELMKGR